MGQLLREVQFIEKWRHLGSGFGTAVQNATFFIKIQINLSKIPKCAEH